jgi:hypothetical protein
LALVFVVALEGCRGAQRQASYFRGSPARRDEFQATQGGVRSRHASDLIATGALAYSEYAHASGDPSIIWWAGAGLLLHLAVLLFVLFSAAFRGIRAAVVTAYVVVVVLLWVWAGGSRGNVSVVGTTVILLPLLLLAAAYLARRRVRTRL